MQIFFLARPITLQEAVSSDGWLEGRLALTDDDRTAIETWEEMNDSWYLDDDGERLDDQTLMGATPWSYRRGETTVKLLRRFIDHATGDARFTAHAPIQLTDYLRT
ncbi:MAG: hypothetical protein AAF666_02815 [Pseudomonadota bacterium]